MKTTTKKHAGIKVTTSVKAGGYDPKWNHTRTGLAVKTGCKAGYKAMQNHSRRGLAIKTSVKAGYKAMQNHNGRPLQLAR